MPVQQSDIQHRFDSLSPFLDERMRRLVAAAESEAMGYGGVSAVARATGVSRRAIAEGIKELKQRNRANRTAPTQVRVRRGRVRDVRERWIRTRACWRIWIAWSIR